MMARGAGAQIDIEADKPEDADAQAEDHKGVGLMRRITIFIAAIAATLGMATAAHANPTCVGTTGTAYVCVDPIGGTLYSDCVYVGQPPCIPVTVPGPIVTCGGRILDPILAC